MRHIYVLSDPTDGVPRYVGQTKSTRLRLAGHMSAARAGLKSPVGRWLRELSAAPDITIIKSGDWSSAESLQEERRAIRSYMLAGQPILNVTAVPAKQMHPVELDAMVTKRAAARGISKSAMAREIDMVHVKMPPAMKAGLKAEAERTGDTIQGVIRAAISARLSGSPAALKRVANVRG